MSNQIANQSINFSFDNHAIRTVILNGDPWFIASDVCAAIALDSTAIRKLDDDEKGLHSAQTPGGVQEVAIISESGLYTIILRCRDAIKPGTISYRFRKWVTGKVLPQIRKTGSYCSQPALPVPTHSPISDDYANRTEMIYYQDFKPIFCRILKSDDIVMSHEAIMNWLESKGLLFFTREELRDMTHEQWLKICE